jgi:hypothetical protein
MADEALHLGIEENEDVEKTKVVVQPELDPTKQSHLAKKACFTTRFYLNSKIIP